jgi:hypothetical protein
MTRTKLANQVSKVIQGIDAKGIRTILGVVVDIVALEMIESGELDPEKTQAAWALLGEAERRASKLRVKAGQAH